MAVNSFASGDLMYLFWLVSIIWPAIMSLIGMAFPRYQFLILYLIFINFSAHWQAKRCLAHVCDNILLYETPFYAKNIAQPFIRVNKKNFYVKPI